MNTDDALVLTWVVYMIMCIIAFICIILMLNSGIEYIETVLI